MQKMSIDNGTPSTTDQELISYYQGFRFHQPQGHEVSKSVETAKIQTTILCAHLTDAYGLKPHGKILDYGGGVGFVSDGFAKQGYEVTLADLDGEACAYAKSTFHGRFEVVNLANSSTLLPKETFDLVYCAQVIEHVASPKTFLLSLEAFLKPGGLLVLSTPNQRSLEWLFRPRWFGRYISKARHLGLVKMARLWLINSWVNFDPPRHLHIFNQVNLRLLAEKIGLDTLECKEEFGHRSVFNTPRSGPGKLRYGLLPLGQFCERSAITFLKCLPTLSKGGNNLYYIGRKR